MYDNRRLDNIEKLLKIINEKLTLLLNKPEKKTWVNVCVIQEITGWDSEGMRRARDNGLIEFKKISTKEYKYLLESIHPYFNPRLPNKEDIKSPT